MAAPHSEQGRGLAPCPTAAANITQSAPGVGRGLAPYPAVSAMAAPISHTASGVGRGLFPYPAVSAPISHTAPGVGRRLAPYPAVSSPIRHTASGVGRGLSPYPAVSAPISHIAPGVGRGLAPYPAVSAPISHTAPGVGRGQAPYPTGAAPFSHTASGVERGSTGAAPFSHTSSGVGRGPTGAAPFNHTASGVGRGPAPYPAVSAMTAPISHTAFGVGRDLPPCPVVSVPNSHTTSGARRCSTGAAPHGLASKVGRAICSARTSHTASGVGRGPAPYRTVAAPTGLAAPGVGRGLAPYPAAASPTTHCAAWLPTTPQLQPSQLSQPNHPLNSLAPVHPVATALGLLVRGPLPASYQLGVGGWPSHPNTIGAAPCPSWSDQQTTMPTTLPMQSDASSVADSDLVVPQLASLPDLVYLVKLFEVGEVGRPSYLDLESQWPKWWQREGVHKDVRWRFLYMKTAYDLVKEFATIAQMSITEAAAALDQSRGLTGPGGPTSAAVPLATFMLEGGMAKMVAAVQVLADAVGPATMPAAAVVGAEGGGPSGGAGRRDPPYPAAAAVAGGGAEGPSGGAGRGGPPYPSAAAMAGTGGEGPG